MKKIAPIIILFLLTSVIKAQDIPFEKKLFKERKEEYKEAVRNLDEGYKLFDVFSSEYIDINDPTFVSRKRAYMEAMPFLIKANKFNPENAELNYKLGRCYLMSSLNKNKSLAHFLKSLKLKPNLSPDIQYHLGISYHLAMEFDKAIAAFTKYKGILYPESYDELKDVNNKIEECNTAKKLISQPKRVFIDNFGKPVNSEYPEYGAIISADESIMMFTSRKNTSTGAENMLPGETEYAEDIYISTKKEGQWIAPVNMGERINTEGHDATTAVSPDGQSMIIYRSLKGDGNLYECKLIGSVWSEPRKMNKNINTKYHESSASYSNDGKTLYFVSNKPGGMGNHDMYVTTWDEQKADWGEAKNLGSVLNTEHDEEAVLIHPDGKTLYFSSRGHKTMGNYDIFKSSLKGDGSWSAPINMGYPINTVDDDVFFVINASGRRGYYSSFRDDGEGEKDIYMITFLGPEKPFQLNAEDNLLANVAQPVSEKVIEKPVDALTKKITILKGITSDCKSSVPVGAAIELIDVDQNKTLATFQSNEKTGKYLVSLPSGKNYGLIVRKEGYLFHSENFNIPETAAYQEVERNICLKGIEIGNIIVLKNIFYDYNKATLRDASKNELDRLTKLLVENASIEIELSAHTDSRGSDGYNEKLSQKRAQSCVDYLINKGIEPSRLVSKGYGETKLIKTDQEIAKLKFEDEKEDAHQENRRTEFKIIAK